MNTISEWKASPKWTDWTWQQQNSIKKLEMLASYFTSIKEGTFIHLAKNNQLRIQITPYFLSNIPKELPEEELITHPLLQQVIPLGAMHTQGHDAYDGTDNWENEDEFPTKLLHHKYTNRALVRLSDCLGYCNFCFEALRTLEKDSKKEKGMEKSEWEKSLVYIKNTAGIEEIVFSGGEPFLLSNQRLEQMFQDIEHINKEVGYKKIRFKRVHTRALTHNPFRITDKLVDIIKRYRVNEIAFDVAHPAEITDEFKAAIERIHEGTGKYTPILAAHIPLIKGLNDSAKTLWDLCAALYEQNIKPYYLIHSMPHIPFTDKQRVPVRKGVKMMQTLKRHKSNIALPEYILAHYDGKITVPLELEGTPEFNYIQEKGDPYIHFKNWKGNWVKYPDAIE